MIRSVVPALATGVAAVCLSAPSSRAQTFIQWANVTGGLWSLPSNWVPQDVPDRPRRDVAVIAASGEYAISLDITVGIAGLEVLNPAARLDILDGRALVIGATDGITNHGTIVINAAGTDPEASIRLDENTLLAGTGIIEMRGDGTNAFIQANAGTLLTQGPGHTLTGTGRFFGRLRNHGAISPGASIGTLELNGEIELTSTSSVAMEIGPSGHDRLTGVADYDLGGELTVTVLSGFVAAYGATFVLIEGDSVSGTFDSVSLPPDTAAGPWRLAYEADRVVLSIGCPADFDQDGFVTGLDFDAFVAAFEAGAEEADFDGDGFVTGLDFDAYVSAFEAGC